MRKRESVLMEKVPGEELVFVSVGYYWDEHWFQSRLWMTCAFGIGLVEALCAASSGLE